MSRAQCRYRTLIEEQRLSWVCSSEGPRARRPVIALSSEVSNWADQALGTVGADGPEAADADLPTPLVPARLAGDQPRPGEEMQRV